MDAGFRKQGSEAADWDEAADDPMLGVFRSVLSDVHEASRRISDRVRHALAEGDPGPSDPAVESRVS